jgi:hypothetical protein
MNFFDNLYNFFSGQKLEPEDIPIAKVDTNSLNPRDEAISKPFTYDFTEWRTYDSQGKKYELTQFERDCNSFYLEERIADYIDVQVRSNPLVSKAYIDHLTMADTDIHVKEVLFTGYSDEASREIYSQFENENVKLYPFCKTQRDISNYRIGHLIRYGVFASQTWIENNKIKEIRVLPAWNCFFKENQGQWQPFQKTKNRGDLYISPVGFCYTPLFPLINDKGVFFVPPLLAGIKHLPSYDLLNQSIQNIGTNLGYSKALRVSADTDGVQKLIDDNGKTEINEKTLIQYLFDKMRELKDMISKSIKLAVMMVPLGLKVEEGSNFEPPENLLEFKNIIYTDIILGLKSYLNTLGMPGQVNQTTVSEVQKNLYKNFIETPQQKNISILKNDLILWASTKGYIVESFEAYHQPPRFDSEIMIENGRKVRLENDEKEKLIAEGIINSKELNQINQKTDE